MPDLCDICSSRLDKSRRVYSKLKIHIFSICILCNTTYLTDTDIHLMQIHIYYNWYSIVSSVLFFVFLNIRHSKDIEHVKSYVVLKKSEILLKECNKTNLNAYFTLLFAATSVYKTSFQPVTINIMKLT